MKKIGLCFSGGGARGAYQIGVAVALKELEIYDQIEVFSGTSIGAANVAVLNSTTIESAKDIWFNMPENPIGKLKSISEIREEAHHLLEAGMYSMDKFSEILTSHIDANNFKGKDVIVTLSESGSVEKGILELVRSTYDHYIAHKNKAVYLDLKELETDLIIDAVKASCAIPFVFQPIINEDKKYYDGGVFDNIPIKPLIERGCTDVIVVVISSLPNRFEKLYGEDVKMDIIKSKRALGNILDFSKEHSEKIYQYGYEDAMAYFTNKKEFSK